jgi:hypothetical protein
MNEKTAWEKAAAAEGATASERLLARLARKVFLSLWSYTNVFTDASQEFIYVDLSDEMSDEEKRHWRAAADELDILRPKTEIRLHRGSAQEFPVLFKFENTDHFQTP